MSATTKKGPLGYCPVATAGAEADLAPLSIANEGARIFDQLPQVRKDAHHKDIKLLIVDDRQSAIDRNIDSHKWLYPSSLGNHIDATTDPLAAKQMILHACGVDRNQHGEYILSDDTSRRPYDLIKLDIHMPSLHGHILANEVFQTLKRLGVQDRLGAIVFDSASIADAQAGRMAKDYTAVLGRLMDNADIPPAALAVLARIPRPALIVDKYSPLDDLVRIEEAAMALRRSGLGDMDAFLDGLKPTLIPENLTREIVHTAVQEAKDAAIAVRDIVTTIETRHNVRVLDEPKRKTLMRLAGTDYGFNDVYVEGNDGETSQRLHDLSNDLVDILPPQPSAFALVGTAGNLLKSELDLWARKIAGPKSLVNSLYLTHLGYTSAELDLNSHVSSKADGTWDCTLGKLPPLSMPIPSDKLMAIDLVDNLIALASDQARLKGCRLSVGSTVSGLDGLPQVPKGQLARMGAKAAVVLDISLIPPPALESASLLETLQMRLGKDMQLGPKPVIVKRKIGCWDMDADTLEGRALRFRVYFPLDKGPGEYPPEAKALQAQTAGQSVSRQTELQPIKIDNYDMFDAYSGVLSGGENVLVLGKKPNDMDFLTPSDISLARSHKNSAGLIFRGKSHTYVATGQRHGDAEFKILISQRSLPGVDEKETQNIHGERIRFNAKIVDGKMCFVLDCEQDDPRGATSAKVLHELGIETDRIIFDPSDFRFRA
jgi:hypothetical protein